MGRGSLPDEMAAVYHGSHGTDCSAAPGKLERPVGFPISLCLVNIILLHSPIATARVDVVAVGTPARAHAPRGNTIPCADARYGILLASIPDP